MGEQWITVVTVLCGEIFLFILMLVETLALYFRFAQPLFSDNDDGTLQVESSIDGHLSPIQNSIKLRLEQSGVLLPYNEIDSSSIRQQITSNSVKY